MKNWIVGLFVLVFAVARVTLSMALMVAFSVPFGVVLILWDLPRMFVVNDDREPVAFCVLKPAMLAIGFLVPPEFVDAK